MKRSRRRRQAGLTLLELVVGVFIALFLTAAAVAFAAHETRLMGISRDRLDMAQASRSAIDLIARDLANAGVGVGYEDSGNFSGLLLDNFSIGGCNFNSAGVPNDFNPPTPVPNGAFENITLTSVDVTGIPGTPYVMPTQDVGIRLADGAYTTIADYDPSLNRGEFCFDDDIAFQSNRLVILRHETGLDAQTGFITTSASVPYPAGGACNYGRCANGCIGFTFAPDTTFQSGPGAATVNYIGGEVQGGFKTIVWFVTSDGNVGTLRRAVFDGSTPGCANRDASLGGNVSDRVETLLVQVSQWVTDPAVFQPTCTQPCWMNAGQVPIQNRFRTRADVELVMRSRTADSRQRAPVLLRLRSGECVPSAAHAPCNSGLSDYGDRTVYRTSVDIKNAGRMALVGGT